MECRICEVRRPRRYCLGVRGDICSLCCGAERENTVDCPFECEYLREARVHERQPVLNPDTFPNRDIRVTEQFLRDHEPLLMYVSAQLLASALETPGAVDLDVREALDALIRTYRTLQTGLIYETRPSNPLAATIQARIQSSVEELRRRLASEGQSAIRDAEVLGVLTFLQRLELQHNNGRRRGRAFLDFLRGYFPAPASAVQPASSPLIQA